MANGRCDSSASRARDSCSEGHGLNLHSRRPLCAGWVGVSIMRPAESEVMVSPLFLFVAAHKIVRYQSCDSLVAREDVKKP